MWAVTSLRCGGNSNTQHELDLQELTQAVDTARAKVDRFQSLIFKRLTFQSDQITRYADAETQRLINEVLEIAEDIQISIDNDADVNLDWIVEDSNNFMDKFQALADAVLGHHRVKSNPWMTR